MGPGLSRRGPPYTTFGLPVTGRMGSLRPHWEPTSEDGPLDPFVEAALGYGHVGGPLGYSAGGLAVRGGAGFILFFSPTFALGLSVTYDTIVDTGYKSWSSRRSSSWRSRTTV